MTPMLIGPGGQLTEKPGNSIAITQNGNNIYLSRLKIDGSTQKFNETTNGMFYVSMYDKGSKASTQISASSFTHTIISDGAGGYTITSTTSYGSGTLVVTTDVVKTTSGYKIRSSCTANSTGKCLEYIFHEFFAIPYGDLDDWHGHSNYYAGFALKSAAKVNVQSIGLSPESMSFCSYWDAVSQHHLYVYSDDEDYYSILWHMLGDGTNSRLTLRHHPDDGHHVNNNTWTMPYYINLECYRGESVDPMNGWQDDALRYRKWATQESRRWMRGSWSFDSNYSTYARNANFMVIHSELGYEGTVYTENSRIMAHTGATAMLDWSYSWDNLQWEGDVNFKVPDYAASKLITNVVNNGSGKCRYTCASHGYSTNDFVSVTAVEGITGNVNLITQITKIDNNTFDGVTSVFTSGTYVSATGGVTKIPAYRSTLYSSWNSMIGASMYPVIYFFQAGWNTGLTQGRYNITKFADYGNIDVRQCMLKAIDGTMSVDPADFPDVAVWDHSNSNVKNILTFVIIDIFAEIGVGLGGTYPLGFYLDAFSSFSSHQNYDTALSSWSWRSWNEGKNLSFKQMRDGIRVIIPSAYFSSEWASQTQLLYTDVVHMTGGYSASLIPMVTSFNYVFGQYVRCTTFENIVLGNNIVYAPRICALFSHQWHMSALPSYSSGWTNAGSPSGIADSPIINSPLYYCWEWLRILTSLYKDSSCLRYFSGKRLKSFVAENSAEAGIIDKNLNYIDFWASYATEFQIQDSSHLDSNTGETAIFLTNSYPLIPYPVTGWEFSMTKNVKLRLNSSDLYLDNQTLKTIYTNSAGTRTKIGEFYGSKEITVSVAPFAAIMIEIVPATLRRITEL